MSDTKPIPIILCGKHKVIAELVNSGMLPEYEVIHVILSTSSAISEIPQILSGTYTYAPSFLSFSRQLGSKNYSEIPQVIVLGGGYDDAEVKAIREACEKKDKELGGGKVKDVPWLRPDPTLPKPKLGPELGKALVDRTKAALEGLKVDGKIVGSGELLF